MASTSVLILPRGTKESPATRAKAWEPSAVNGILSRVQGVKVKSIIKKVSWVDERTTFTEELFDSSLLLPTQVPSTENRAQPDEALVMNTLSCTGSDAIQEVLTESLHNLPCTVPVKAVNSLDNISIGIVNSNTLDVNSNLLKEKCDDDTLESAAVNSPEQAIEVSLPKNCEMKTPIRKSCLTNNIPTVNASGIDIDNIDRVNVSCRQNVPNDSNSVTLETVNGKEVVVVSPTAEDVTEQPAKICKVKAINKPKLGTASKNCRYTNVSAKVRRYKYDELQLLFNRNVKGLPEYPAQNSGHGENSSNTQRPCKNTPQENDHKLYECFVNSRISNNLTNSHYRKGNLPKLPSKNFELRKCFRSIERNKTEFYTQNCSPQSGKYREITSCWPVIGHGIRNKHVPIDRHLFQIKQDVPPSSYDMKHVNRNNNTHFLSKKDWSSAMGQASCGRDNTVDDKVASVERTIYFPGKYQRSNHAKINRPPPHHYSSNGTKFERYNSIKSNYVGYQQCISDISEQQSNYYASRCYDAKFLFCADSFTTDPVDILRFKSPVDSIPSIQSGGSQHCGIQVFDPAEPKRRVAVDQRRRKCLQTKSLLNELSYGHQNVSIGVKWPKGVGRGVAIASNTTYV